MQVLAADGARINVRIDGDAGETVVLLAGFPLTREIWKSTVAHLAPARRVVRPDIRGIGATSVSDGPYLMELLAGDVAATLDALGVERATLVGHSLGGYVALAFARMFAERLNRLALVCSRLSADTAQQARAREELALQLEREGNSEALVTAYVPRLLCEETKRQKPEIVEYVSAIARHIDPRGAAAILRGMAFRGDSFDIAPDIGVPVLVIAGGADSVVPLDESRAMAAAFPRAEFAVTEHSGHLPMLEEPASIASLLSDWLAKTSLA
jgi:3-oxoadipate enol-lactonase